MKVVEEIEIKKGIKLITIDEDIPYNVGKAVIIDGKNYSFALPFELNRDLVIETNDKLIDKDISFIFKK
ncbi:MAG: hypothetical protein ACI4WG_03590 [Erysipelotrichaceae bacterium]